MTDFKKLVLGNVGKGDVSNPFKKKASKGKARKRKGKWSDKEEEYPRKKKPTEGNIWVDVSNWF